MTTDSTRRRDAETVALDHRVAATLAALGASIRSARRRRRLRQADVAARVGVSRSTISRVELGRGSGLPIGAWLAIADAVGLPLRFDIGRDPLREPIDAGHLAIEELLLRLGRLAGRRGGFEMPIGGLDQRRPGGAVGWIDVLERDDRHGCLIVSEAWNTIEDIGAAARSFARKLAAAAEAGIAIGGERPYSAHGVWVVRATERNRALVARYPEAFASRFPGSSRAWVEALERGARPPAEPGLVWCDVRATRVFAWRRRGSGGR
jgi:transcriptional regulator with XRE-family HTH domain